MDRKQRALISCTVTTQLTCSFVFALCSISHIQHQRQFWFEKQAKYLIYHQSLVVRKPFFFAYAKTKTQISFAVTAKLISTFVFATQIVQSLYFPYTKFQASSHLVWLYSLGCVGPGRKPRRPIFSQRGSPNTHHTCCT